MRSVGIGTWLLFAVAVAALLYLTVPTGIIQLPTQPGSLDLLWPLHYLPVLIVGPALLGLILWSPFALLVYWRTMKVLRTRPNATFLWPPCDECDPSEEKVDRLGRQLAGIPQPVMHWADWRATAIRIQLLSAEPVEAGGPGRVEYRLQVAERMTAGLFSATDQIDCNCEEGLIRVRPPFWPRGRPVGPQEQVDE